jgi:hypothetical protein
MFGCIPPFCDEFNYMKLMNYAKKEWHYAVNLKPEILEYEKITISLSGNTDGESQTLLITLIEPCPERPIHFSWIVMYLKTSHMLHFPKYLYDFPYFIHGTLRHIFP